MHISRRHFMASGATSALLSGDGIAASLGKHRWSLPPKRDVRKIDVVRIPMPDGIRLCGRIWLPAEAEARPVPMVLEYIPYRTRDGYSAADNHWGGTLASYGIGYARIDIRGSGDSEGLLRDEYLASEQDDAVAIIAWLARQKWCSGAVGMRGISWGGFSTVQTAMRNPPALKAIMPMACSDRRFTDDAHYVGGCLGLTNFKWGVNFKGVMAGPPDPAVFGPGWATEWRRRLEASPPIIARWTSHQREDAYWRHGSLFTDYAAIKCPTYIVGGWADAYVHSVPRMLEGLSCPRKALVGPWGHTYPWLGGPGPTLDWAFEEVRWWSQWLLGQDTGIMDEPMLRFFRPTATPSQSLPGATPGHWAAESHWPSKAVRSRRYHLTDAGLLTISGRAARRRHKSNNAVGLRTPEWVPFGLQEFPGDQSADDARSVCFDGRPLAHDLELLGVPKIRLRLSADRPVAQVAVRLCKLRPDGTSWRIGYGVLNLTHRTGHSDPTPLVPGEAVEVDIPLGFLAHQLHAGERLRVAISEGLWPLVWPSPQGPTLTILPAGCALDLPVRSPPALEPAMPIPVTAIPPDKGSVVVTTDEQRGQLRVTGRWPDAKRSCWNGTELSGYGPNTVATIAVGDPNSGRWSGDRISRYRRGDWQCELRITFSVTSTAERFNVVETISAFRDGAQIFERTSTEAIKRDLI